jgi:NAD-dependent dihydropyrimidine dehydrogenase PreA subunit
MGKSKEIINKNTSPMIGNEEIKFLTLSKKYPEYFIHAHNDSKQEGFEYFYSNMTIETLKGFISRFLHLGKGLGIVNRFKIVRNMIRNFRTIFKGRKESFKDIQPYYKRIKNNKKFPPSKHTNSLKSPTSKELWDELIAYAKEKWGLKVGFTKLPTQLIFKGKAVLFKYVLIFIQEMREKMINHAPNTIAGAEVMRVYGTLGLAVNDIARWLRSKGIICQANHPLGGLVNLPPMAAKAGMGWQGHHGLLITPEFGPRHRIAPIFIEKKLFEYTDNQSHRWIEEWCNLCRKCERACPTGAIKSEKKTSIKKVPGIGKTKTCIDREMCFPYFNKTFGCSICIKVCPFSNGINTYKHLKNTVEKRKIKVKVE